MKYTNTVIILTFLNCAIAVSSILYLYCRLETVKGEANQLQRERNMYDSLYRTANTKLYQFQDSINKHCICK